VRQWKRPPTRLVGLPPPTSIISPDKLILSKPFSICIFMFSIGFFVWLTTVCCLALSLYNFSWLSFTELGGLVACQHTLLGDRRLRGNRGHGRSSKRIIHIRYGVLCAFAAPMITFLMRRWLLLSYYRVCLSKAPGNYGLDFVWATTGCSHIYEALWTLSLINAWQARRRWPNEY